jgi:hypothetical protein
VAVEAVAVKAIKMVLLVVLAAEVLWMLVLAVLELQDKEAMVVEIQARYLVVAEAAVPAELEEQLVQAVALVEQDLHHLYREHQQLTLAVVAVDHLQCLLLVVLVVLVLAETGALRLEHQLQPDLHLQALVEAEVLTAPQAIILVLMVVMVL